MQNKPTRNITNHKSQTPTTLVTPGGPNLGNPPDGPFGTWGMRLQAFG